MSTCSRCGAPFSCAMVDADPSAPAQPCWCTYLPAALPVPSAPGASCWCPDCLKQHIAAGPGPRTIAPPQPSPESPSDNGESTGQERAK